MEDQLFVISSSPHIESEDSIPKIMWTVILALIPAMASAVIFFGIKAVLLILTCVATSVFTEYVFQKARKKAITVNDGSAIITGILLALVLSPDFSLLSAVLGSVVAIAIGKHVFGGLGYNIFNPALVGRAFLQATYPVDMTTWVEPWTRSFFSLTPPADAVSAATPLGGAEVSHIALFIGKVGGCLGETSALAVLLGGVYLLCKKYIDWRIPAGYLGAVFVLGTILWRLNPDKYFDPLFHLLAGGLMLGAFFMATDMVTSPMTPGGAWLFGIGAGVLVTIFRLPGGVPEGVMFSILIMNAVTPLLNRYTRPKVFGSENLQQSEG